MVRSRGHGAHTVVTSGQTLINASTQKTVPVASIIDSFEEGERCWRRRFSAVAHVLDCHMGVTDYFTSLELLGSRVVRGIRVCEGTSLQIIGLHLDIECLVSCEVVTALGVEQQRGDHVLCARYFSHDYTVARPFLNLKAISRCLAGAKIDEVVVITAQESVNAAIWNCKQYIRE